jgi:hypothetical protein
LLKTSPMRFLRWILVSTCLAACATGVPDVTGTSPDAGEDERPDARPRPDAAGQGALTPDAGQASPDAAPTSSPDAASPDAAPAPSVVTNSDFAVTAFDSMNLIDKCTQRAQWGATSWGMTGETFATPYTLASARFTTKDGQAYLYGKEDDGRFGAVTFVQGDVWGHGNCADAIPWNVFTPVAMAGRDARVQVRVFRDTDNLLPGPEGWLLMGVSAWFSSPDLPVAGGDVNGKKPLVLDLAVHHECTGTDCALEPFDGDGVYYYQTLAKQSASKAWTSVDLDLSTYLEEAIAHFHLEAAAASMKLYQLEFVIEVQNAEGAASIDDFKLIVN